MLIVPVVILVLIPHLSSPPAPEGWDKDLKCNTTTTTVAQHHHCTAILLPSPTLILLFQLPHLLTSVLLLTRP